MKTIIGKLKTPIVKSLLLLAIGTVGLQAQVVKPGHCWNERVGWINMSGVDLDVETHTFKGDATIVDGNYNGNGFESGKIGFTAQGNLEVNLAADKDANDNYAITGQAFSEQIGWVVADHSANAPAIVKPNGELGGNFWSDEFGWIQCDKDDIGETNGVSNAQIWSLVDVIVSDTNITAFEKGGSATFTVKLASEPTSTVVITVTQARLGSASMPRDKRELKFSSSNWSQPQSITVTPINDTAIDPNDYSLFTLSVDDPYSDDAYDDVEDKVVRLDIINDDLDTPQDPVLLSSSDTGVDSSDHYSSELKPEIDFTCRAAGNIIKFYTDGAKTGDTFTCPAAGVYQGRVDILKVLHGVLDGHDGYYIGYSEALSNGDDSYPAVTNYIPDTAKPEIMIYEPKNNFLTKHPNLTISYDAQNGPNSSYGGDMNMTVYDENNHIVYTEWTRDVDDSRKAFFTAPDGVHTYRLTLIDRAGNKADDVSITITVDTTPPATPATAPTLDPASDTGAVNDDNKTNDATPTYHTTCTDGDVVQLRVDNVVVGSATCANGTAAVTPSSPIADGTHSVTFTEVDPAGNVSAASPAHSITIKATNSDVPQLTGISDDTGVKTDDNITTDTTLQFNGTAGANATVEVFVNGVSVGMTTADGGGVWHYDHTATPLVDGTYAITARTIDEYGNNSALSEALQATVDTTAPAQPSVSVDLANGVDKPVLTFSAMDNTGIDHYEIDYDGAGTFAVTTSPAAPTLAAASAHSATIRAYDAAGNFSEVTVSWPPEIKIAAPTVTSQNAITDTSITVTTPSNTHDIESITIVGAGSNFSCKGADDGTAAPYKSPAVCTGTVTVTGDLNISAVEADTGAQGSATQHYVVDNALPVVSITAPTKSSNSAITDTRITVTDNEGILAASVVLGAGTDANTSNFTCTQTTQTQVDCTVSINNGTTNQGIEVKATDTAGNQAVKTEGGYTADTVAPPAPTINEPLTATVQGLGEVGAVVTATTPSGASCTATVENNGTYTCVLGPNPQEGEQVTATQQDAVGNVSPSSTTTGGVDVTPPTKPLAPDVEGAPATDNPKPEISGRCSNTDNLTIYANGAMIAENVLCANNAYSVIPASEFASGTYDVTVKATDLAGNDSPISDATTVTIVNAKTDDTDGDGIPDATEINNGTNPNDPNDPVTNGNGDDDGDGIPNGLEHYLGGDNTSIDNTTDTDGDGIPDVTEIKNGTDPKNPDDPTANGAGDDDGDGIPNGLEVLVGGDTNSTTATQDTDGDGIPDVTEVKNGTDPKNPDDPTANGAGDDDGDGIPNGLEHYLGGDNTSIDNTTDTDGDGIPDATEVKNGTNPKDSNDPVANGAGDDDGDGIPNGLEVLVGGDTNSTTATQDTDGDGIPDVTEVKNGTDPKNSDDPVANGAGDDDGDGIPNGLEYYLGGDNTSIDNTTDTDGDGIPDVDEIKDGTDPKDPNDFKWYEDKEENGERTIKHVGLSSEVKVETALNPQVDKTHDDIVVNVTKENEAVNIGDETIPAACGEKITYKAFVEVYKEGRVSTGYERISSACSQIRKFDPTATQGFRFAPGTKARLRTPSAEEQSQFGDSQMVIVDDVVLEVGSITLGEI